MPSHTISAANTVVHCPFTHHGSTFARRVDGAQNECVTVQ